MKSMLHEASSILKAIEKAWTESGKPAEFTVKILEKGEKNFLGMSKRPAIISITYGSNVGFDRSKNRDYNQPKTFNKKPYNDQFPQQPKEQQSRDNRQQQKPLQQARPLKEDFKRQTQPSQPQFPKPVQKGMPERVVPRPVKNDSAVAKDILVDGDIQSWNDEMVNFCSSNLKEILSILKFDVSFTAKINNKNLVITFDKNITSAVVEDLKSFFAGIAHILMQFLKRKHKKRLRGLQIIVNTTASNESSNPNKSN